MYIHVYVPHTKTMYSATGVVGGIKEANVTDGDSQPKTRRGRPRKQVKANVQQGNDQPEASRHENKSTACTCTCSFTKDEQQCQLCNKTREEGYMYMYQPDTNTLELPEESVGTVTACNDRDNIPAQEGNKKRSHDDEINEYSYKKTKVSSTQMSNMVTNQEQKTPCTQNPDNDALLQTYPFPRRRVQLIRKVNVSKEDNNQTNDSGRVLTCDTDGCMSAETDGIITAGNTNEGEKNVQKNQDSEDGRGRNNENKETRGRGRARARGRGRSQGRGRGRRRGRGRGCSRNQETEARNKTDCQQSDMNKAITGEMYLPCSRSVRQRGRPRGRRRGHSVRVRGGYRYSEKQMSNDEENVADCDTMTSVEGNHHLSRKSRRQCQSRSATATSSSRRYSTRREIHRGSDEETLSHQETKELHHEKEIKDTNKWTTQDNADQKTDQVQIDLWKAQYKELGYAKCPVCYCRRRSMDSMQQHFQSCSAKKRDSYPCRHCQREFQSSAGLKYHLLAAHFDTNQQSASTDGQEVSSADLNLILHKIGKLACRVPDCKKSFGTMSGYLYHQKTCGKEALQLNCEVCGKIYTSKGGLVYHMKVVHAPPPEPVSQPQIEDTSIPQGGGRIKRRAAERALTSMQDIAKDMMENTSDRSTNGDQATKRQKNKKKQGDQQDEESDSFDIGTDDDDDDDEGLEDDSDFNHDSEEESTNEMRRENHKRHTVKERIPHFMEKANNERKRRFDQSEGQTHVASAFDVDWSSWKQLSERKSCRYLPVAQKSVPFKYSSSTADQSPLSLQLFQAISSSQSEPNPCINMFVGGPVWSIAWCPHPSNISTMTEYAMISCHRSHDDYHYINRQYTGPGAVQLWAFDGLEQVSQPKPVCKLVCCMAHEYGCIWDMKWCPSGCWQPTSPSSTDNTTSSHSTDNTTSSQSSGRIGLLAIACSDGSLRIINVPSAHCVETFKESSFSPTVVSLQSALTLWPGLDPSGKIVSSFGQCWCVDWAPDNGHTKVAAGFSNGSVAMWDLLCQSPLLRVCQPTGLIVLPYSMYDAHDSRVMSLSWCPYDSNYLVSVSTDRHVKMWDVRSPDVAFLNVVLGACSDCKWMDYSGAVAVTQDNTRNTVNRIVCFCTGANVTTHASRGFATSGSSDWGLDFSDWLHSLLMCNDDGDVSFFVVPQALRFGSMKKEQLDGHQWHVYSTQIHQLQTWNNTQSSSVSVVNTACPKNGQVFQSSGKMTSPCSIMANETSHHTASTNNGVRSHVDPNTDPNHHLHTPDDAVIINQEPLQAPTEAIAHSQSSSSDLHLKKDLEAGQLKCTLPVDEAGLVSLQDTLVSSIVQLQLSNADVAVTTSGRSSATRCKEPDSVTECMSWMSNNTNPTSSNKHHPTNSIKPSCRDRLVLGSETGFTWGKPTTFQEFVDKVYISFEDSAMDNLRSKAWKKRSQPASLTTDSRPSSQHYNHHSLVAVHKACFNPNLGTHTWILSGGQTGIVRAHRITAMHSQRSIRAKKDQQQLCMDS